MSRDILRDKIYLGALLHDIGKFYQRADPDGVAKSKLLSSSVKNSEAVFCPEFQGNYSHKHVLWTAQFIEDMGIHLKKISGDSEYTLEHLAAKHHKPSNFYEEIIQMADHLSSGMDRAEGTPFSDESKSWDSFKKVRMLSVFENLLKDDEPDFNFKLPVGAIKLTEDFFPRTNFETHPDYKSLWEGFMSEVKFIQTDSYQVFAESLYSLLYKYTCNIVSSTINLPDVSLFDHLKTTAAIAVCLYYVSVEKGFSSLSEIRNYKKPLLLVGGDISGIQNYIYDILTKSAAKNLKGRSFYVQLLVDSIIQKLLNHLGLFSSNIIYSSGGGFYLLAPNSANVKEKIKNATHKIGELIFSRHGTDLYLALETEEVSIDNIKNKKINENWRSLTEKLNLQKRQCYRDQLSAKYEYFFEPSGEGADFERDAFSGEEFREGEKKIKYTDSADVVQFIKPYTEQQIRLGQLLKKTDYFISADEELNFIRNKLSVEICDIGIFHYFLAEADLKDHRSKIRDFKGKVRILNLNNLNFLDTQNGINNIFGFNLYGGNKYPTDDKGDPLSFDKFAGDGDFKRLGYLRMDVDNLGAAFIGGFTDERRTFSRYSTLSRSLDYFFKGFINSIWEKEKYNQSTFIIYSGGDDLFLVGRWDILLEMAEEIREKFREWTCHNPRLTISGGVAVVDEKFPVLKASQMAGDAESGAKEHVIEESSKKLKNAFSVLGMPLNWDTEYYWVKNMKNNLKILLDSDEIPRSFISKFYSHFANAKIENHKITQLSVLWLMAYDFSRMANSVKKEKTDARNFIHNVKDWIFTNKHPELQTTQYHLFELINLAVRWAELELRTIKK
ncbi:MAG: type III-A CRISPR-associated protein Cas10/Csm1 [Bacteroidales bacterium]|jgi:CRISPR-associated protein Csm1|nr:type III-A CRISPR-associated protein Cas10/Csm1 [Bacteroidales bacterium]